MKSRLQEFTNLQIFNHFPISSVNYFKIPPIAKKKMLQLRYITNYQVSEVHNAFSSQSRK